MAAERRSRQGRPIFIHPEGTRRPPGAPPDYKYGVVHLYKELGVPVVAASAQLRPLLAAGGGFMRFPGTIIVSFLPTIEPGLSSRAFLNRLVEETEGECDRLLVEADKTDPRPPFGPEATAKLAEIEAVGSNKA